MITQGTKILTCTLLPSVNGRDFTIVFECLNDFEYSQTRIHGSKDVLNIDVKCFTNSTVKLFARNTETNQIILTVLTVNNDLNTLKLNPPKNGWDLQQIDEK